MELERQQLVLGRQLGLEELLAEQLERWQRQRLLEGIQHQFVIEYRHFLYRQS